MSTISLKVVLATVLLGACFQASADDRADPGIEPSEARLRTVLAYELADVKSPAQLAAHLRRAGNGSPLAALSPAARNRFLESLSFNGNGLTQYRYDDMQRELTATQSYRILRLFGAEQSAPFLRASRIETEVDAGIAAFMRLKDYDGAKCVAHGTCEKYWPSYICTSNC